MPNTGIFSLIKGAGFKRASWIPAFLAQSGRRRWLQKQQKSNLELLSPKRAQRKETFQKLGEFLSRFSNEYAWRDYLGDHEFTIKCKKSQDPELRGDPRGPIMKTQQWERTVRRGRT